MWPAWILLRTYGPYITFPIALVAGFIGYHIEEKIRKQRPEWEYLEKSVEQQRSERQMKEAEERRTIGMNDDRNYSSTGDNLEIDLKKKYVPKSSLERNLVGPSQR